MTTLLTLLSQLKAAGGKDGLRACPFCNETPASVKMGRDTLIFCDNDECRVVAEALDIDFQTAKAIWNTRADTLSPRMLDAVEKVVGALGQWKCLFCRDGKARRFVGNLPDETEPCECGECNGTGLNPKATAALAELHAAIEGSLKP